MMNLNNDERVTNTYHHYQNKYKHYNKLKGRERSVIHIAEREMSERGGRESCGVAIFLKYLNK